MFLCDSSEDDKVERGQCDKCVQSSLLSPSSKQLRALPLSYFLETLSLSRSLSTPRVLIFILLMIWDERNLYGIGFITVCQRKRASRKSCVEKHNIWSGREERHIGVTLYKLDWIRWCSTYVVYTSLAFYVKEADQKDRHTMKPHKCLKINK